MAILLPSSMDHWTPPGARLTAFHEDLVKGGPENLIQRRLVVTVVVLPHDAVPFKPPVVRDFRPKFVK